MNLPALGPWVFNVAACLLVGALAWTIGRQVHALLRISDASRGYWIAVGAIAVIPPSVAMALQWLWVGGGTALPTALPLGDAVGDLSAWSMVLVDAPERGASGLSNTGLELSLLLTYLSGAGLSAYGWLRGVWSVHRLVQDSSALDPLPLGPLSRHEVRQLTRLGISARLIEASVSPFAVCWPRPAILVPAAVAMHLSDAQLRTVLRHEAAHLAARDPQFAAAMRLVRAVFWFNPFLARIAQRIQLAAELRCDAKAIAGEPNARRACAEAYVGTLRLGSQRPIAASAAFSSADTDIHELRIRHMLQGDPRGTPRFAVRVMLAGTALMTGTVLAATQFGAAGPGRESATIEQAEPAVAGVATERRRNPVSSHTTLPALSTSASTPIFRFPIEDPEITGVFGEAGGRTRPHRGVDFRGRSGTTVLAPASGVVVAATTLYQDSPEYGTVVVLDHGGGWQTLYAHLARFDVSVGDRVSTGERIGRVGVTGKVTGPHLHMELLLNGQRLDPQPLLR